MNARQGPYVIERAEDVMRGQNDQYECFCGEPFGSREDLISHNVEVHGMNEGESRRAVMEKYPE